MSTIADLIERYIKQQIRRSENQAVALSRAQLAELFSCVPSQINYVLTTRFTLERGYVIESRRGGGGYIRVAQIKSQDRHRLAEELFMEIGEEITEGESEQFLASFHDLDVISSEQVKLIRAILQRETAMAIQAREALRASLLRATIFLIMYK